MASLPTTNTTASKTITHAQEIVHLTAADEHRKNFSLTNIDSSINCKKGREIFLPGVHADIGGSYRDGPGEDQWVFSKKSIFSASKQAEAEKARLVAANWYKETELTIRRITLDTVIITAERDTISNRYSRIPLHIMAKLARETDYTESSIVFKTKLVRKEKIIPELETANTVTQAYVDQHKAKGARSSRPEDWHGDQHGWLRDLRYGYFHFSAKSAPPYMSALFPHAPNYENGKRQRKTRLG